MSTEAISNPDVLSFTSFQANPAARQMFEKLGLRHHLQSADNWRSLRHAIVDFNDCDAGHFVALVRQCDGVCSSGERPLLHAIAAVCDFAWLADEFALKALRSAS